MWKFILYTLKQSATPFDVIDDGYYVRRHISCHWDKSAGPAHLFTAVDIQQAHTKDLKPTQRKFNVELEMLTETNAKAFAAYFTSITKDTMYKGPELAVFDNVVTLEADHIAQVYQLMLIAAMYDPSLKKVVYEDMKIGFQPIYTEVSSNVTALEHHAQLFAHTDDMAEKSNTKRCTLSPDDNNITLTGENINRFAKWLKIVRERGNMASADLGDPDKRHDYLRKVINPHIQKDTRFKSPIRTTHK